MAFSTTFKMHDELQSKDAALKLLTLEIKEHQKKLVDSFLLDLQDFSTKNNFDSIITTNIMSQLFFHITNENINETCNILKYLIKPSDQLNPSAIDILTKLSLDVVPVVNNPPSLPVVDIVPVINNPPSLPVVDIVPVINNPPSLPVVDIVPVVNNPPSLPVVDVVPVVNNPPSLPVVDNPPIASLNKIPIIPVVDLLNESIKSFPVEKTFTSILDAMFPSKSPIPVNQSFIYTLNRIYAEQVPEKTRNDVSSLQIPELLSSFMKS